MKNIFLESKLNRAKANKNDCQTMTLPASYRHRYNDNPVKGYSLVNITGREYWAVSANFGPRNPVRIYVPAGKTEREKLISEEVAVQIRMGFLSSIRSLNEDTSRVCRGEKPIGKIFPRMYEIRDLAQGERSVVTTMESWLEYLGEVKKFAKRGGWDKGFQMKDVSQKEKGE